MTGKRGCARRPRVPSLCLPMLEVLPMRRVLTTSFALAALVFSGTLPTLAQQSQPAPPSSAATPAQAGDWVYAISLQGTPRYKPGFTHWDYVNPNAPKGGTVRLSGLSMTFDTLNPLLPKGVPADGLGLIYQDLLTRNLDEVDISAEYPELADALKFPADYSAVTYRLNAKAKWQDGTPVTAEDVVWSFNKATELNPMQKFYYQHVKSVAKTG